MMEGRSRTGSMINSESYKVIQNNNIECLVMDKDQFDQVNLNITVITLLFSFNNLKSTSTK
jgi:hypothetical protein